MVGTGSTPKKSSEFTFFYFGFQFGTHPKLVQLQQGNDDMHQHCLTVSDEKEISVQLSALSVQSQGCLSPASFVLWYIPARLSLSPRAGKRTRISFCKKSFHYGSKRNFSEFIVRIEHKIDNIYSAFRSFPGLNWNENFLVCECFGEKTTANTFAHEHEYM